MTFQILSEEEFAASFPYSSSLVDLINCCMDKGRTGRSWDPALKAWRFKMAARDEVTSIFSSAGCKVQGINPKALGILHGLAAPQNAGPSSSPSGSKGSYTPSMSQQEAVETMRRSLPPETFDALFQFQREGVAFIVRHGGRVLLADEPGLGKTVQV